MTLENIKEALKESLSRTEKMIVHHDDTFPEPEAYYRGRESALTLALYYLDHFED